jgi:hypothetical protein
MQKVPGYKVKICAMGPNRRAQERERAAAEAAQMCGAPIRD